MNASLSSSPFVNVDLWLLPNDSHRLNYGDFLLLHDNVYNVSPEQFLSVIGDMAGQPCKISCHLGAVCLDGQIDFSINLASYSLLRGQTVCISTGTLCELTRITPDCRLIFLAIRPDLLPACISTGHFAEISKIIQNTPQCNLTDDELLTVTGLYRLMRHTISQPNHRTRHEVMEGLMKTLFNVGVNVILRNGESEHREPAGRQREIFEHFLNLVRANYHRERLVSFYADRMCLTPKYLSMVVYRVSGRHAGEWIRDFVVLDAKALLQSRKYTVSQVADMLGFPNNSFFGKWFKAATGMPPRRYACGGKG